MKLLEYLILSGLLALINGCASTPTQYITLAPKSASAKLAASALPQHGLPIVVAHVQMPADIDRLYLTTLHGTHRMQVADHIRWVAPLGGMAKKVLAQDLAADLPRKTVLMPGDPLPSGQYLLVIVNVQRFLPDSDGQVMLHADWFIRNMPSGKILSQGRSQLHHLTSDSSPSDQAAAMSHLIAVLASVLTARL
ncbi:MAG: PqiC family protein [Acidithiobacillus ferrivorans]